MEYREILIQRDKIAEKIEDKLKKILCLYDIFIYDFNKYIYGGDFEIGKGDLNAFCCGYTQGEFITLIELYKYIKDTLSLDRYDVLLYIYKIYKIA